jgi:hypothetical protein
MTALSFGYWILDFGWNKTMNDDQKIAKKQAKTQVKAEKKQVQGEGEKVNGFSGPTDSTPAQRSAAAAERQVRLQFWRVAFALVSTLIALATLGMVFFKQ